MGDLISRSELLKIIEDEEQGLPIDAEKYHVDKNVVDGMKASLSAIKNIVTEQQTAYDVEKVVEQLENLEPFHVDGYGDDFVNLYDAIEIVKQVGAGTDDVCEWKYPKEIMDNTEFEVSCNSRPLKRGIVPNNFSFYDFKYCPYCGKKIKVVE